MALHGAHVSGEVTSGANDLEDATVVAIRAGDAKAFTSTTDATGAYSMTLLCGHLRHDRIEVPGHPQTLADQVVVSDTSPTSTSAYPMTTYPLSGQLFENGSCDPITGTVAIGAPANMTVTTDAQGMYQVLLLRYVHLTARASVIGYQPAVETVTVAGAADEELHPGRGP